MPASKHRGQHEGETDLQYAFRLQRRKRLIRQVNEEIRFAAAGRGLSLAEVSHRMGDPTGRLVASNADTAVSLSRLADLGTAMGVTFRVVALPDDDVSMTNGSRPSSTRKFKPNQVREIRRRVAAGERPVDLGREFGCVPSLISDIKRGKAYRDVV